MWILIVGLVLLAIVAMIAGYIRNKRLQKKIDNGEQPAGCRQQTDRVL